MPKIALLLLLILLFPLSACQAPPTPEAVSTTSVVQQTEIASPIPETAYPTSAAKESEVPYPAPYPASTSGSAAPQTEVAYPVPYPGYSPNAAYPGPYPGSPEYGVAQLEPYVFKTSSPGTATLHGILLVTDPMLSRPQDEDAIYLVPLVGEDVMTIPPFKVGEVPQAEVNEVTGEFTFTDIQPGRYAVVVLTVGDAQIPARFYEKNSFAIINIEDSDLGQTIELEYIFI